MGADSTCIQRRLTLEARETHRKTNNRGKQQRQGNKTPNNSRTKSTSASSSPTKNHKCLLVYVLLYNRGTWWLGCLVGGRVRRWVVGWVGRGSIVHQCCRCCYYYLELFASHCCAIADPQHTRQKREAVWRQLPNTDI